MAKFNVGKKVKVDPKVIEVEWNDEKFKVTYNRNALTTRFMRESRMQENESQAEPTSRMLMRVLLDWDCVEEDGKTPYPMTLEAIEELAIKFQGAIMDAVWADLNPPPPTETPSGSFG